MSAGPVALLGADIFDGARILSGRALVLGEGRVRAIVAPATLDPGVETVELAGGTLAPGFVDLQVNGGGGVMFNDAQDVETLATIARAHARIGATAILPTLITDSFERTRDAIAAVKSALAEGVPGIAGLHLEGPHLSVARKGAHDPSLIRPMDDRDLTMLTAAARELPALLLTVAPENVTPAQIGALRAAGALVSLGHSDTTFESCKAAADAGACCVTHLFNAMSPLGHREPGVVGAALSDGRLSAGLIADLIHVHPATIGIALRAKARPGRIFLVTDAMAVAGTATDRFTLNGREILRRDGRLTLADGTLAGADLDMATAIGNLMGVVGLPLAEALAMATSVPARLAGIGHHAGWLAPGRSADIVHLDTDSRLAGVWQAGERIV